MTTTTMPIEQPTSIQSTLPADMIEVCSVDDLILNSGICALINENQVAIFYVKNNATSDAGFSVYATSNYDPIGKANVMYRGLLCSQSTEQMKDEPMICSPLYKQHYSLISGQCIEQEEHALLVYQCKVFNGRVYVKNQAEGTANKESTHKVTAA